MDVKIVGLVLGLVGKVRATAGKGAGNELSWVSAKKCGGDVSGAVKLFLGRGKEGSARCVEHTEENGGSSCLFLNGTNQCWLSHVFLVPS
jgi:hypothetical protein